LKRKNLWIAGILLFLMTILPNFCFYLEFYRFDTPGAPVLFWFNYLSFGFLTLLFFMVLTRDVLFLGTCLTVWVWGQGKTLFGGRNGVRRGSLGLPGHPGPAGNPGHPGPNVSVRPSFPGPQADLERRRRVFHYSNLGLIALALVLCAYGLYEARRVPRVVDIEVRIEGLETEFEGLKIVQLSDLHIGPTIRRNWVQALADRVRDLDPDLIAITGDLIDGGVEDLRPEVEPLSRLAAPLGVFFITGNHEYYSGVQEWVDETRRMGWTVLLNEHRILTRGQGRLVLAGVSDYHGGRFLKEHASDPTRAFQDAPSGVPRILLAHQPKTVRHLGSLAVDLVLCGHTHGGQYIPWNRVVALDQTYLAGLHQVGPTQLYVSRGAGYWGPPLRLGAPSDITRITLKRAEPR
jgi:predicted MPP superfamily phosphohydrolase